MVEPVFKVVSFALEHARGQLLKRQHQVNRRRVSHILLDLCTTKQDTLEALFAHKVDVRTRPPLLLLPYLSPAQIWS